MKSLSDTCRDKATTVSSSPFFYSELDDPRPAILRLLVTATSRMPWRMRTSPAATVTVYLVTRKASDRRHARRAVDTYVRHPALPLGEMRLECLAAREGMPRDHVLLHVADAILRLALCARPIRCAGARTEAPMLRERDELVVKLNRPAHLPWRTTSARGLSFSTSSGTPSKVVNGSRAQRTSALAFRRGSPRTQML